MTFVDPFAATLCTPPSSSDDRERMPSGRACSTWGSGNAVPKRVLRLRDRLPPVAGARAAGGAAVGVLAWGTPGQRTVTLGANQHVRDRADDRFSSVPAISPTSPVLRHRVGPIEPIFLERLACRTVGHDLQPVRPDLVAFLVVAPLAGGTPADRLRFTIPSAKPWEARAAGINVARVRYAALATGGALMAVGGALFTLAVLGSFHPGHHRRPRLRASPWSSSVGGLAGVIGALLFRCSPSSSASGSCPAGTACRSSCSGCRTWRSSSPPLSGRNVAYPAYRPYRRSVTGHPGRGDPFRRI